MGRRVRLGRRLIVSVLEAATFVPLVSFVPTAPQRATELPTALPDTESRY